MSYRDYYNILGVPRDASQEDVKRAYRNLALRWHPDRNADDPEAGRRFKDISEAYRTLGDPERRARYDRMGPLYTEDGRPPRPEDLGEVMGTVWKNLFGRKTREPGEDLRYSISVTLEDVATGTERTIVVPRRIRCNRCAGHGAEASQRETCSACGGSGMSKGRLLKTRCYHCDGRGYVVRDTCERCEGEGRVVIDESIVVKVPPGVATGQKLKVKGKGNAARGEGTDGDLLIVVNVADHPLFRRRGDDLLVEVPLDVRELSLGADIRVPTLDGTTTIRVPAGTPGGKIFRLSGRGLPHVGRSGRGDLHIQVALEIPVSLTPEEEEGLRRWAQVLPDDRHPKRAAFQRALEERA